MRTECEYNFTVLLEPAEEGGYVVTCPALPGLVTEGDTLEEARERAKDTIRAYLESLHKDGLPVPPRRPGVRVGDTLEAKVQKGKIRLIPTTVIDRGIAESLGQFKKGKSFGPFDTAEEMLTSLHSKSRKLRGQKRKRSPR